VGRETILERMTQSIGEHGMKTLCKESNTADYVQEAAGRPSSGASVLAEGDTNLNRDWNLRGDSGTEYPDTQMHLLNHSSESMTLAYLGLDQASTENMLNQIDFG